MLASGSTAARPVVCVVAQWYGRAASAQKAQTVLHTIESTTSEQLTVTVTTTADPTATVPDFALTTTTTEPTTWVAGSWSGTWNSTTGEVTAKTPLIGDSETLAVVAGTDYDLWVRWTVAAETPVKQCRGRLRVT